VCPPDAAGVRGGEEIGLQLKSTLGRVASGRSRRAPLAESTAARHSQHARVYSGVLRVARGGSGAEAPPLAARWIMIFDFVIVKSGHTSGHGISSPGHEDILNRTFDPKMCAGGAN